MSKINMPGESFANPSIPFFWRIRILWRLKLGVTVIVCVCFWSLYLFLSRHSLFPVHTLPMTWLDAWAGFRPNPWTWIYESIFLLTGVAPWLIVSREELRRYIIGFTLLSAVSFISFVLFPVASPRPGDLGANGFLIFITQVDGPLNAFPSLHAGCLVYSLALVRHLFQRSLVPLVAVALLIWAGLILFATLATKQHYAIDLLAGGLLGWAADQLAWRKPVAGDKDSMRMRRNKGVPSQAG